MPREITITVSDETYASLMDEMDTATSLSDLCRFIINDYLGIDESCVISDAEE